MPTIADSYISADFVARFKIIKVYPNQDKEDFYKADIEILEQFKGLETNSIYIGGRSDGKIGTSCDVFHPVDSELVVMSSKNAEGQLVFGMCSYVINLQTKRSSNQRDLDLIRSLSQWDHTYSSNLEYVVSSEFPDFLESKKGIQLKEEYALFEVEFNDEQLVVGVDMIKGFDDPVDAELLDILSTSTYKLNPFGSEKSNSRKIVVPVYFYPAEKGNNSFLSQFTF